MVEIEHLLDMQHFRVVYCRRVCIASGTSGTFYSYTMRKGYIAICLPSHLQQLNSQILTFENRIPTEGNKRPQVRIADLFL